MTRYPMAKAKAKLAELVNRVRYGAEVVQIERHGRPVAVLVSPERFARLAAAERAALDEPPRR